MGRDPDDHPQYPEGSMSDAGRTGRIIPGFSVKPVADELGHDYEGDVAMTCGVLGSLSARPTREDVATLLGHAHPDNWHRSEGDIHSVILPGGGVLAIVEMDSPGGIAGHLFALPFEALLVRNSRWAVNIMLPDEPGNASDIQ